MVGGKNGCRAVLVRGGKAFQKLHEKRDLGVNAESKCDQVRSASRVRIVVQDCVAKEGKGKTMEGQSIRGMVERDTQMPWSPQHMPHLAATSASLPLLASNFLDRRPTWRWWERQQALGNQFRPAGKLLPVQQHVYVRLSSAQACCLCDLSSAQACLFVGTGEHRADAATSAHGLNT